MLFVMWSLEGPSNVCQMRPRSTILETMRPHALFTAAICYLCHNVSLLVVVTVTKLQLDRGQTDRISLTHDLDL